MPRYHLTIIERGKIEAWTNLGRRQQFMADELACSQSAISRELARCSKGKYCAAKAQRNYDFKRKECGRPLTLEHGPLRDYVREQLVEGLSPEQISGTIKLDFPSDHRMRISHETIYLALYNDPKWKCFQQYLRRKHKKRRKRSGTYSQRGTIPNRIGIEHRPAEVELLEEVGHWEGDTVIGANQEGAIVTLVERKYDWLRAIWVPNRKAAVVAQAILKIMSDIPKHLLKTITFDNGKEFTQHELMGEALGVDIYFAAPYSSWQRARNENMNGLLREYFPKKTSFKHLQQEEVQRAVDTLNNRPRKKHGFERPQHFFNELVPCT